MFGRKFHNLEKDEQKRILKKMVTAGTNHEGKSAREIANDKGISVRQARKLRNRV